MAYETKMLAFINISRQFMVGFAIGVVLSVSLSVWKWNQKEELPKNAPRKVPKKVKKNSELKLVIVIPKDLKLVKRELIAQTVNACIGAVKKSVHEYPHLVKMWQRLGQAKVALKANNEGELLLLKDAADRENLVNFLVRNGDPSKNNPLVLVIGPDFVDSINVVSGHLKLY